MATAKKDFNPDELITANRNHEQKLSELSDRLKNVEGRVLTNESFARSFCDAAQNDKRIDGVIKNSIDEHDKHKIVINAVALLKWLAVLVIGGLIGALITALVTGG